MSYDFPHKEDHDNKTMIRGTEPQKEDNEL